MRTACPAPCTSIPSSCNQGRPNRKHAATLLCRCAQQADPSNREQVLRVLQKSAAKGRVKNRSLQTRERSPPGDDAGPALQRNINNDGAEVPVRANPFDSGGPPRELSARELLAFERKGYICTRGLLREAELAPLQAEVRRQSDARYLAALQHRVRVLLPDHLQLPVTSKEQGLRHLWSHSKELGFLQHFNLHRHAIHPLLPHAWQPAISPCLSSCMVWKFCKGK